MKKLNLIIASLIISATIQAQVTFDYSYLGNKIRYLDKFHLSGYKYVEVDNPNLTIKIYNLNNTLFKTINIPVQTPTVNNIAVSYLSENLFDNDNLIEYVLISSINTSTSGPGWHYQFRVYKETGTQMFYRDSAYYVGVSSNANAFNNTDAIFYDGTNTKLRVGIGNGTILSKTEYYTLGGSIPCSLCVEPGAAVGVSGNSGPINNSKATFYPNPVTDQLKLKYQLPSDYKTAGIKIYDTQGKLLEDFKVTDSFDFIYLPSSYDNGLYFYSLIVNDQVIKTEKIILSK